MHIKTKIRYHFTPIRMDIIKNPREVLVKLREQGTILTCWWDHKLVQPLWKNYGDSSKT